MDLSMTEKRGMRPENRVFYENIFKLIDTDGGGELDKNELKAALASMGERLTEADVMDLIDEIDADGFGTVNKDEFIDLIEKRIKDKDLMQYSYQAFKLFSETKENHLTHKEIMDILGYYSKTMSQDEIDDIVKSLPWLEDKTVDINSFLTEFFENL